MTEQEIDLLAEKIVEKLFTSGHFQVEEYPAATEEEIYVAELARLMTLLSAYEETEQYEKAAIIKNKIDRIQHQLDRL